jgi:hypothetical protein
VVVLALLLLPLLPQAASVANNVTANEIGNRVFLCNMWGRSGYSLANPSLNGKEASLLKEYSVC